MSSALGLIGLTPEEEATLVQLRETEGLTGIHMHEQARSAATESQGASVAEGVASPPPRAPPSPPPRACLALPDALGCAVSRQPPRMRRSSAFVSFPSVPDAPPKEWWGQGEAGDATWRGEGAPAGCEEGDELDECELPAEFGFTIGSVAHPPSPARTKPASFPPPPPFVGRERSDDEGDDLIELPMEFFPCAPSSTEPSTNLAARALQALPTNQTSGAARREAPVKARDDPGKISDPLSTPFHDVFQGLSDAFYRAID